MARDIVSSFSLSHAAILDGTTAAELSDIYGVNDGSLELETDVYERTGDDVILSTNRWITKGTLSLKSNYLSLGMVSKLWGIPKVADTSDPTLEVIMQQLWTEKGMNIAPRPVLIRTGGEDSDGTPLEIDIILYKVKFGYYNFDQFFSYKEGLSISFDGDVLLSDKDELGKPFTDDQGKRIGRIVTKKEVTP